MVNVQSYMGGRLIGSYTSFSKIQSSFSLYFKAARKSDRVSGYPCRDVHCHNKNILTNRNSKENLGQTPEDLNKV